MIEINAFFTGFVVIAAVALALLAGFVATEAIRFFARNRTVRIARRQPIGRYYAQLAFGH